MILNVYSVKDTKTAIYNQPFFGHNDEVAKRIFGININDTNSLISTYPEEYALYKVGEYDDTTGRFKQETEHMLVSEAYSLKKEPTNGQVKA